MLHPCEERGHELSTGVVLAQPDPTGLRGKLAYLPRLKRSGLLDIDRVLKGRDNLLHVLALGSRKLQRLIAYAATLAVSSEKPRNNATRKNVIAFDKLEGCRRGQRWRLPCIPRVLVRGGCWWLRGFGTPLDHAPGSGG